MAIRDRIRNYVMRFFSHPDFLSVLHDNLQPFQRLMSFYQCAIMEIETKFKVLEEEFSLRYDRNPIETIKTRLKSPESIARKLDQRGVAFSLQAIEENISDIAGVRVICSFPQDIYLLADCLLRQDDITLIERKDYISNPKPSGYRSLHLVVEVPIFLQNEKRAVRAEVQLRTIAMDFWASLEHKLQYKKDVSQADAQSLAQELYECSQISAALDYRMEEIKNKIIAD